MLSCSPRTPYPTHSLIANAAGCDSPPAVLQPAAMLPLIDMANHSFEPNAKIAPGPGGSMCMVATRQLVAGEPVLISYGPLGNDFLLLDYGMPITLPQWAAVSCLCVYHMCVTDPVAWIPFVTPLVFREVSTLGCLMQPMCRCISVLLLHPAIH